MDVILKVLEGAKVGTKIAVKKDEFLVGRSQKCHLCAGSSSISRRHCVIRRKETKVTIEDLGSRNGTLVNGKKTQGEVELSSGDELGIGTLKLLLTISQGINNLKRPKVKSVADAVDRTVADGGSSVGEEDITSWLLESAATSPSDSSASTEVMNETQTIQLDDTNAMHLKKEAEDAAAKKASAKGAAEDSSSALDGADATVSEETVSESKKGKKKKPEPGKLPTRPEEPGSKDSREAAMQALRNWNRRR